MANDYGGGVYMASNIDYYSTFTMHNGLISGNEAYDGGGVFIGNDVISTMHDGIIRNNTAQNDGGGIWIDVNSRNALTIFTSAVFYDNLALAGFFNYGLADGLVDYPNIRWQGYAVGQNSFLGSHLLNNYDINNRTVNPNYRIVTFIGNGGTVFGESSHSFLVPYGTFLSSGQVPAPPDVIRSGYTFLGWSESASAGSTLITNWNFPITEDRVFYAQWIPGSENDCDKLLKIIILLIFICLSCPAKKPCCENCCKRCYKHCCEHCCKLCCKHCCNNCKLENIKNNRQS